MGTIEQLTQQVQLLTQKMLEQEALLKTSSVTKFQLTASQVIKNFNDVKPFSGEGNYKLKSFLKQIENAEKLCEDVNRELR